jgi:SAM-dependent methyltransferase
MSNAFDWAARSGDAWAARWRDTDRALSGLAPPLQETIAAAAPSGPFTAFDVGCGPGSTTLGLAQARPDARIVACDLSPALVEVARERLRDFRLVDVVLADAQQVALERAPFDLIYSRHGVMFFADPFAAFADLRRAATDGCKLVFSCFQDWSANPWASQLASAAAGRQLPPPGREPSGFAFADPDYVRDILHSGGWREAEVESVGFAYIPGEGDFAVEQAVAFLSEIGPASNVVRELAGEQREEAVQRMRVIVQQHFNGTRVEFDAAASIWAATAGAAR